MQDNVHTPYILGLDIGVASIGWAVLELDADGCPRGIRRAGVHLFQAGIDAGKSDPETAMLQGREQSRAKPRRDARSMRRQTWRRARRKRKALNALIRIGLLPEGDVRTPEAIDRYLKAFDAGLRERWATGDHTNAQTLFYRLRAAAVAGPIERHDLGRALYHLAQRRGFLSNRKSPDRAGEDRSEMKQQIGELAGLIAAHDPPTLGAYLASIDPDEQRIRGRWTARSMYTDEFDRIWNAQAAAHGLTDVQRAEIEDAIFRQRPLKDQSHLVGRCSLLPDHKRAPIAERVSQRFRVMQQVNHLRIVLDDSTERPLSRDERQRLIDALLKDGDLTVAKARTTAGLPRGSTLSIERGGEKKLIGHRTDARLRSIFGDERWDALDEEAKDGVVHAVRSIREPDVLRRMGINRWGLDNAAADALGDTTLEEGHAAHCREALARLTDRMEHDGLSYSEARKDEYPGSFESTDPVDLLPPLEDWESDLRNPSVARAMTELRKVVNAIIRRWGKPARIHVEMARDLKSGRGKREKIAKRMRDRETERERAAKAIADALGIREPVRWMIEKWMLAEECGWQCPYTGRHFGAQELLGRESQFDVEHIWPYSKSLDNSYQNKTICQHEENRSRKKGRTPSGAYAPEELAAIVERVKKFRGDPFTVREKVRRFAEPIDEGFTARHLQETRYIGRLACDYLGLLYGGRAEDVGGETRRQRIVTPAGGLTAWLRRGWGLNAVLSDSDEKERDDHRHHAIDAIVVACADQRAIQLLASAAERMERAGKDRPFDAIDPPWPSFVGDAGAAIGPILVSHRLSKRVRGGLHKDTNYSRPHTSKGGGTHHRLRTELSALTANDLEQGRILDKRAEAAIRVRLAELGEPNPAKAFKNPANLPTVRGHGGKPVTLRRVRVAESLNPVTIGRGVNERQVKNESNFHTVVYEYPDKKGRRVWAHKVVSLLDAARAAGGGEGGKGFRPILPDLPEGARVLFTLTNGECLEMADPKHPDRREIFRIRQISEGDLLVIRTTDNRKSAISGKDRIRIKGSGDKLRELGARKVRVTLLGEVVGAGG